MQVTVCTPGKSYELLYLCLYFIFVSVLFLFILREAHIGLSMCVKVRGQFVGAASLLPSRALWRIELGVSGLAASPFSS